MKKNKIIVGIVVLALLVWGGVSLFSSKKEDNNKPINLGVILPLSGSGAEQGEWFKRGFDLALGEININRKQKVNLIYDDSKGDPKNAISIYNSLKLRDSVPVIFTWGSGVGLALTPLVNKDNVIQMGIATAAPTYSTLDDFTFRNFPSANLEAEFLADAIINKLKVKRIAIMKINNDYGISSAKSFRENYEHKGGNIIGEEIFESNATDLRTQLIKIKGFSPEYIYIATYPKEGGLILRQAKELGIKSKFIAPVAILGGKDFFNAAGESAEGLILANSIPIFNEGKDEQTKLFAENYRNKYGEELGVQQLYGARSYDSLKIINRVMDICGTNTECLKNELFKIKNYNGISGNITFDRNGDIESSFNLQVIKNGQFVKLEE